MRRAAAILALLCAVPASAASQRCAHITGGAVDNVVIVDPATATPGVDCSNPNVQIGWAFAGGVYTPAPPPSANRPYISTNRGWRSGFNSAVNPEQLSAPLAPGQVNDAQIFGDGKFATGSTAFSSATAKFSAADVGKTIALRRGLNSASDFTTTFSAYVDAHSMTLAAAPSAPAYYHAMSATVVTPQSGVGSYAPGSVVTVSGGAQTQPATFTVNETQAVSASVVSGGTGGTNGLCAVTGTTGAGIKFQASGTVMGGALTGALVVGPAGAYWQNPTTLVAEPVTGCGLSGATVTVTMGVLTLTPAQFGVYSALPIAGAFDPQTQTVSTSPVGVSDSGSGTGATISVLWEGETFVYGHDATTALQAALASLPPSGGSVQLLNGGYLISDTITLPSNTALYGSGASTIYASGLLVGPGATKPPGISGVGVSNVTVRDLAVSYPHSHPASHAIRFTGASHVAIRGVVGDGGGDLTAMVGSSDTLVSDSVATNVDNACFDQWGGATDARVIGNYCSTWPQAGAGVGGIQFTGITSAGGAAVSEGFTAVGNTVHVQNANNPQGVVCNGPASGNGDARGFTISANHIIVDFGRSAWGVLVSGSAHRGIISDNVFSGNGGAYGAVGVLATAGAITVSHNVAYNWRAGASGVFFNSGVGGTLDLNDAGSAP